MTKIRSMTGFASASSPLGESQISVDLKSVNHRFLDVNIRLPSGAESMEARIQQRIREKLTRGRIDVTVTRAAPVKGSGGAVFQKELFANAFITLSGQLKSAILNEEERAKLISRLLLSRSEILSFGDPSLPPDPAVVEASIDSALGQSLRQLIAMRETEGATLLAHLKTHLSSVSDFINQVKPLAPESVKRFRERVTERLKNADLTLSEDRLAAEVALLADRTDITEELERLGSHVAQFHELLDTGGEMGKKLDFLTQEMSREINTIGSKSQHSQISRHVVDTKAAVEKLREQIQNIE